MLRAPEVCAIPRRGVTPCRPDDEEDPVRTFVRVVLTTLLAPLAALACGGGGDKPAESAPAASTAAKAPAATDSAVATVAVGGSVDSIGRAVYATCTTCHQANGQGVAGAFPPLAGSEIVNGKPEVVVAIILHGLQGPVTVQGVEYNSLMTPWGAMFNDVQIAAVATYIRSQWGNSADPVPAALVTRVRGATASRTTMWTWPEVSRATF